MREAEECEEGAEEIRHRRGIEAEEAQGKGITELVSDD